MRAPVGAGDRTDDQEDERHDQKAMQAGLAALRWLGKGYGYEVTGADVWAAYSQTIEAAERLGRHDEIRARIRELLPASAFVTNLLASQLRPGKPPGNSKKS